MDEKIVQRFWAKVDIREPEACWAWTGAIVRKDRRGYFSFEGKITPAYRIAWILTYGPIPENMCICHACDNANCVNPSHLFIGTSGDNTRDMFAKGHKPSSCFNSGELHPNHKLTERQVKEIRAIYQQGNHTQRKLAEIYNVGEGTIEDIIHRRTWVHI